MVKEFIQDIHYYMDGDRVVFTALFLIQRGQCCGFKCANCPYNPKHTKGNLVLAEENIIFNT